MNVTVDAHWYQLSSRATVKSSGGYYTYSNSLSLLGGASQNVFQQAARKRWGNRVVAEGQAGGPSRGF
jgi:hypothetical protein